MIKCRQEIAAYTFRKYTRHIRQLLSHPSNDNKSSYQENMLLCQRVLVAGFLTWVITSHICEIFGCTEIALDFHWLVKLLQRWSLSLLPPPPPPPDFWVEAIGFMYCPTTCTHSSDLVRGKQGVYISGYSAKGNYFLQNSNIQCMFVGLCTSQLLCLVSEIER